jgi:hypothetical protein
MMRARAGLNADEARGKITEEIFDVVPPKPAANHRLAAAVGPVNLENGLGDIETNDVDFLRHGRSPLRATPNDDPFQGHGGRGCPCHHARRQFFELADIAKNARRGRTAAAISPIALEAVKRIDVLFDIERDINGLAAAERLAVRQERSVPLLADLETWLREQRSKLSRSSSFAKPVDYMLKRWCDFARFAEDGRICLTMRRNELCVVWPLEERHGCSPVPIAALTGPPSCMRSS